MGYSTVWTCHSFHWKCWDPVQFRNTMITISWQPSNHKTWDTKTLKISDNFWACCDISLYFYLVGFYVYIQNLWIQQVCFRLLWSFLCHFHSNWCNLWYYSRVFVCCFPLTACIVINKSTITIIAFVISGMRRDVNVLIHLDVKKALQGNPSCHLRLILGPCLFVPSMFWQHLLWLIHRRNETLHFWEQSDLDRRLRWSCTCQILWKDRNVAWERDNSISTVPLGKHYLFYLFLVIKWNINGMHINWVRI